MRTKSSLRRPFARPSGGWLSRLAWAFQTRHRPRPMPGFIVYRGSPIKGSGDFANRRS